MRNRLFVWFTLLGFVCNAQTLDIAKELEALQRDVPLNYSAEISQLVNEYTNSKKHTTQKALNQFFNKEQQLRALFIESKIPDELRYVALAYLIERDENLIDRVGPFALNAQEAKSNGLEVSKYIDERYDILKSARAFVQTISRLHVKSQDWKQALQDHISSSQKPEKLSHSEGIFYKRYVAALYVAKNTSSLDLSDSTVLAEVEDVKIAKYTTLYQLASQLNIDTKKLEELNPVYKINIIPNDGRDHFLTIPKDKVELYNKLGDDLYTYVRTPVFNRTEVKIVEVFVADTNKNGVGREILYDDDLDKDEVYYSVRNGDILLKIADLFDCEVVEIVRWNKIQKDRLSINQRIIIKVDPEKRAYYQSIDQMTNAQRAAIIKKD